ncbi:MAG: hypothetical protein WCL51_08875 [Bacteroidota bacterium]
MTNIDDINSLSNNNEQEEGFKEKQTEQQYEEEYLSIIDDIIKHKAEASLKNVRQFTVKFFNWENDSNNYIRNFSTELNMVIDSSIYLYDEDESEINSNQHYFCLENGKRITMKDMVNYISGNLKRVYDYCEQNGLYPQFEFKSYKNNDGVNLIIKW